MIKSTDAHSLFQLIPNDKFNDLLLKWSVDRKVKTLTTLSQFKIMALGYILGIHTLREIEMAFGVAKSTFGDACQKRSSGFFEDLAKLLVWEIHKNSKGRQFKKAIREILAIDSTESRLPSSMSKLFRWRGRTNANKGASKLHVVWNVHKGWIEDFRSTGALDHDLSTARKFKLRPDKTYVFDRAYVDLGFWVQIERAGSHFVTRLKKFGKSKNLLLRINEYSPNKDGILYDGDWYPSERACYDIKFPYKVLVYRQIVYRDPDTKKLFHFITSDFEIDAIEVTRIYKQRWSIELLFKWLKGHLGIRSFAVKSKNAVKSWFAVSVCVHLLLNLKKLLESYQGTLWELMREIKIYSLFRNSMQKAYPVSKSSSGLSGGP